MRRSVARGRVFPQSYSTDRRYGRLSLKACALFPLMWANADDQGRLPGDPDEIKYATCPNIDHITKADIAELLEELEKNQLIKVYNTSKMEAIQLLDWWDVHRPQWAWPSQYPPPEGWQDHLRYKKSAKEVATFNWFSQVSTQASNNNSSGERSGEMGSERFPGLPKETENETEKERGKRRGKGNSPEDSGEKPSPSLAGSSLFQFLVDTFPKAWGRIPNSRETAQLRDLGKEISSAGSATAQQIHDAFKEAANQNKLHISYVRKILHAWLGFERGPPD